MRILKRAMFVRFISGVLHGLLEQIKEMGSRHRRSDTPPPPPTLPGISTSIVEVLALFILDFIGDSAVR